MTANAPRLRGGGTEGTISSNLSSSAAPLVVNHQEPPKGSMSLPTAVSPALMLGQPAVGIIELTW